MAFGLAEDARLGSESCYGIYGGLTYGERDALRRSRSASCAPQPECIVKAGCGTATRYRDQGCRCDACRAAATRQLKRYRVLTRADSKGRPTVPLRVPVAPVAEHVATLRASGWTLTDIAAEVGTTLANLSWTIHNSQAMDRRRAAAILALQPATDAGVDEVLVERVVDAVRAGRRDGWPPLDREHRVAVVAEWDRRGLSGNELVRVLGISGSTLRALRDAARHDRGQEAS